MESCKAENTFLTVKYQSGSIMLLGYVNAGGTDVLHKIDGIIRKEDYEKILKEHFKTSAWKLKFGQLDKYTAKPLN